MGGGIPGPPIQILVLSRTPGEEAGRRQSRGSLQVEGSARAPARSLLISRAAPSFLVCGMGMGWRGSGPSIAPSRCTEAGTGRKVSSALS